jgi:hypothetical protein
MEIDAAAVLRIALGGSSAMVHFYPPNQSWQFPFRLHSVILGAERRRLPMTDPYIGRTDPVNTRRTRRGSGILGFLGLLVLALLVWLAWHYFENRMAPTPPVTTSTAPAAPAGSPAAPDSQ